MPCSTMTVAASTFLALCSLVLLLGLVWFAVVSVREREWRAARVTFALAILVPGVLCAATFLPAWLKVSVALAVGIGLLVFLAFWVIPQGPSVLPPGGRRELPFDERDIMFARVRLDPNSDEFARYYEMRPENRAPDDRIRHLPGLLSPESLLAEDSVFALARKRFAACDALRHEVDGAVATTPCQWSPVAATAELVQMAIRAGAVRAGATQLDPAHVYSHVGRGTGDWGDVVELPHKYAVAFTVEMDHATMQQAPLAPVVAESAQQYLNAARIAVDVAAVIRSRGYSARAHIDGNYLVVAPLVARDAGLGEIGRMGLLITPDLGPRVRLGVVTTELPLATAPRMDDLSVIDACTVCRKCADACPSRAIPVGDRTSVDSEGLRWKVDDLACFALWSKLGTDCGRCMAVCPYSHPDEGTHNLVRWAMRRNGRLRRLLLKLDDVFYGR